MDNSSLETSSTGNVERHQPGLTSQPIVIVIPAYNEERFIGSVVLKARQFCHHVIVVDDGSSDATAELAALAGAQVIRHAENRGKGAALNSGLHAARQFEPAAVVMLDADGQHSPDEINKLISPVIAGQADLVIGSRYLGNSSQTPRHRIWGHWAFNWLTRLSSGVPSSDSQSGFRAISGQALRLAEVPITIQYRDRPKRNALSHGIMVLNGLLRLMGQYRPLLFFGVSGGFLLAAGLIWGWVVVDIYVRKMQLAVGYAMISVLLTILGSLLLTTGFILHSVRGLLMDMRDQIRNR